MFIRLFDGHLQRWEQDTGGKGEEEQWLLENLIWMRWIFFFLTQNVYLTGKWKGGFFNYPINILLSFHNGILMIM